MDHAARFRSGVVDAAMEHQRLGGAVSAGLGAVGVDFGQARGIELAEAGVGRRDEEAAIGPYADVAGRGMHITTRMERCTDAADFFP